MISRLTGVLSAIDGPPSTTSAAATVDASAEVSYEVLLPAFLAESLRTRLGERISFVTLQYFESQNQGASFVPRLIGFTSTRQRDFFDVFTTVKGIGNKRALRAMAVDPAVIAAAIEARDARALIKLPEIGKRMAETVIAELHGKVAGFLGADWVAGAAGEAGVSGSRPTLNGAMGEAVAALVALGESGTEAERRVGAAVSRAGPGAGSLNADEVLALVWR